MRYCRFCGKTITGTSYKYFWDYVTGFESAIHHACIEDERRERTMKNLNCMHCKFPIFPPKFVTTFFSDGTSGALHLHCSNAYHEKKQREEAEARTYCR